MTAVSLTINGLMDVTNDHLYFTLPEAKSFSWPAVWTLTVWSLVWPEGLALCYETCQFASNPLQGRHTPRTVQIIVGLLEPSALGGTLHLSAESLAQMLQAGVICCQGERDLRAARNIWKVSCTSCLQSRLPNYDQTRARHAGCVRIQARVMQAVLQRSSCFKGLRARMSLIRASSDWPKDRPLPRPPNCTSIKGLMVSTRWYLGCLKG